MDEITVELVSDADDVFETLRMAQIAFARLVSQDKSIYPKISEVWMRVSIALAKEAA